MQPLKCLLNFTLKKKMEELKVSLLFKVPIMPTSIIGCVGNMLDFLAKNDVVKEYPFSENVKRAGVIDFERPKYCEFSQLTDK